MVGVIGDAAGSDSLRTERNEGDVAYRHAPASTISRVCSPATFDEYNEGNQIAKTAATQSDVPRDATFTTLDEDGTACSSDYYLRLTGDGGRMLRKEIPFTFVRPTPTK